MGTGHEVIGIEAATILEWRSDAGTVLMRGTFAPGAVVSGLLPSATESPYLDPYRLYSRPVDGSAEWRQILRFDPLTGDIVRFDR